MLKWCAVALALLVQAVPAQSQTKLDHVSVGVVISLANAPYFVALAKGYLKDAGIETDSGSFKGAQDMTSSLATGQLDVGLGAFNAGFFNAAHEGLDLRGVAALGYQPSPVIATPPLVRKDLWDNGTIRSGKDLRGHKVAVNTPGATPEYTLSLILQKYGMTLKDVDETMLSFPQMVIALENKAVDVAFVSAPFHTIALQAGTAVLLKPEAGVTAGDITTVVFFSGKFLRERRGVGIRFLRALVRGAGETGPGYTKDPATAALLAKATGLKLALIEASIPFAFDPHLDIVRFEPSIRRQETQHGKDGRLNYKGHVPMDKMIDASLLKAAVSGTN